MWVFIYCRRTYPRSYLNKRMFCGDNNCWSPPESHSRPAGPDEHCVYAEFACVRVPFKPSPASNASLHHLTPRFTPREQIFIYCVLIIVFAGFPVDRNATKQFFNTACYGLQFEFQGVLFLYVLLFHLYTKTINNITCTNTCLFPK